MELVLKGREREHPPSGARRYAAIPVVDLSDEPPPPGLSLRASEQPLGPPAPVVAVLT